MITIAQLSRLLVTFSVILGAHAAIAQNTPTSIWERAIEAARDRDVETAVRLFERCAQSAPNAPQIHYNLGYAYKLAGKLEQAIAAYERAIALDPDYVDAHFGLSLVCLLAGNFERGWQEHEWRRKFPGTRQLPLPVWDGSDPASKTIILQCEGQFGDAIQFIRFAQVLHKRGAHVVAGTKKQLLPLFALCPYIDQLITAGDPLPPADFIIPYMSIPTALNLSVETVPTPIPYIHTNPQRDQHWHDFIHTNSHLKIGICWQAGNGDPNWEKHIRRSIPLATFAHFAHLPNVDVYSLQKDPAPEDVQLLAELGFADLSWALAESEGGFLNTASIVKQLDLIVSADTAVVHLSGALGKRTWLFLPVEPNWRWMLEREDTPWYPTMQLFRQRKPEDYEYLGQRLFEELVQLIHLHSKEERLCKN